METQTTLKSSLLSLIEATDEEELKCFIQKYLDKKDLTSYFELKHIVSMWNLTKVNDQIPHIINTIKWCVPSVRA